MSEPARMWTQQPRVGERLGREQRTFRHAHPVLRAKEHLRHEDYRDCGCADITWHGTQAWRPDWGHDLPLKSPPSNTKEGDDADEEVAKSRKRTTSRRDLGRNDSF